MVGYHSEDVCEIEARGGCGGVKFVVVEVTGPVQGAAAATGGYYKN